MISNGVKLGVGRQADLSKKINNLSNPVKKGGCRVLGPNPVKGEKSNLLILKAGPELQWRTAHFLLKNAAKMRGILKSAFISNV